MEKNRKSELISRFMRGITDKRENQELLHLLDDPNDKEFNEVCQELWKDGKEMDQERKDRMRIQMMRRISEHEAGLRAGKAGFWKKAAIAFSAAAALFIATFTGYRIATHQDSGQEYRICCANGERSTVTLPDGTTVRLNSASALTYGSSYNERNREVRLTGEAFFDVAHDERHPFTVTAGEMEVKVLGTKFNLKAYADENGVEATLLEGRIMASVNGHEEILNPDERLSFDRKTGKMVRTTGLGRDNAAPWISGELDFRHSTLAEIAAILERMHDIEIVFEDEGISTCSYTGHVKENSLDYVLDLISSTSGLKYRRDGRTVTISRK